MTFMPERRQCRRCEASYMEWRGLGQKSKRCQGCYISDLEDILNRAVTIARIRGGDFSKLPETISGLYKRIGALSRALGEVVDCESMDDVDWEQVRALHKEHAVKTICRGGC